MTSIDKCDREIIRAKDDKEKESMESDTEAGVGGVERVGIKASMAVCMHMMQQI